MTATDGMLSVKIVIFVVLGVDVPTWKAFEEGDKIHLRGCSRTGMESYRSPAQP